MKNKVKCLCRSLQIEGGLIFSEEENNYQTVGRFVIEANINNELASTYLFPVIDGGYVYDLTLRRDEHQQSEPIFVAEIPELAVKVLFKAKKISPNFWYVGKQIEMQNHQELWELEMIPDPRTESLCEQADIFFIGVTDLNYSASPSLDGMMVS